MAVPRKPVLPVTAIRLPARDSAITAHCLPDGKDLYQLVETDYRGEVSNEAVISGTGPEPVKERVSDRVQDRVNERLEARSNTKTQILDAALASFGTAGFDGTSLDDLARGLGIRKQTILYHFVSKRGLLNAVVDRGASDLTGAMDEILRGADRDWKRVEALVRRVFRVALEQPVLLGLLREVSRPGSPGAQRLHTHMEPMMARARLWIEGEMAAGRMRRADAQLLLISAYSTVVGVATETEVLRAAGIEPTLRPVVRRRRELLNFLRSSLDPRD
jgi:AcrR family transcriptional regulator|tara:strand:+ start:36482 stop:37306 length:825 start_codon:yes stop_codon:yes gene_type:complete